jgi:biotin carboxyl carrier protein
LKYKIIGKDKAFISIPEHITGHQAIMCSIFDSEQMTTHKRCEIVVDQRAQVILIDCGNGIQKSIQIKSVRLANDPITGHQELQLDYFHKGHKHIKVTIEPIVPYDPQSRNQQSGDFRLHSQMTGKVLKVGKKVGDKVTQGEEIFVVEAMKMENKILAPLSGTITKIGAQEGASVQSGGLLAVIAAEIPSST